MKIHRLIISVVLIAAIMGGGFLLRNKFISMKAEPARHAIPEAVRYVESMVIEYGDQGTELQLFGRVSSSDAIALIAEVPGRMQSGAVPLKTGHNFKEGQLLASIYSRDVELALQAKKSAFLNRLALALPDIQLDYPEQFEAWNAYFSDLVIEGSMPPLPSYESADKFKTFLAAKGIISEYYAILAEEEQLKKYTIYAPFTGSYTQVYLQNGSVVTPGMRIAEMARSGDLELRVPVQAEFVEHIRKGQEVRIYENSGPGEWSGSIDRISDVLNPMTQSIDAYVKIRRNPEFPLFEGQYLRAVMETPDFGQVVEVPRKVVYGDDVAYVIRKGVLEKRKVDIVFANYETFLIRGLEEGDTLLMESLTNAREGMKVKILD